MGGDNKAYKKKKYQLQNKQIHIWTVQDRTRLHD